MYYLLFFPCTTTNIKAETYCRANLPTDLETLNRMARTAGAHTTITRGEICVKIAEVTGGITTNTPEERANNRKGHDEKVKKLRGEVAAWKRTGRPLPPHLIEFQVMYGFE